jgi:hypothetical protein
VFDFDGDGRAELIYGDEIRIRAFAGANGESVWSIPNTSGTTHEYPLVVDLDNDGHADLVTVANNYSNLPNQTVSVQGIRVFRDENNSWVNVRGVWNQHAYSIDNINDDLTVPASPPRSWLTHNTFRLNKRLDVAATAVADLTASYIRVDDRGGEAPSTLAVRVGNAGRLPVAAGAKVAFYSGASQSGGVLLRVVPTTLRLEAGHFEDITLSVATSLTSISTLVVVADDDGAGRSGITDFDRRNNTATLALSALPGSFAIAVATDKPQYTDGETAAFTAEVSNGGSFAGAARVRFAIETGDGAVVVETLSSDLQGKLAALGHEAFQALWPVGAVLAGSYRLRAELIDGSGRPFAAAYANFTLTTAATVAASTRLTTDKTRYAPIDRAAVQPRVRNVTVNALIENATAVTRVRTPAGAVAFERIEAIAQLLPGAAREFNYSVPLLTGTVGVWSATLELRDAAGALIATSGTSFEVEPTAKTGFGVSGALAVQPKEVEEGAAADLAYSVTNSGNSALSAQPLLIRVLDVARGVLLNESQASADIAQGATFAGNVAWTVTAPAQSDLVGALYARVEGAERLLAQDSFRVIDAFKVHVAAGPVRPGRVLVLVSCPVNADGTGADRPECIAERIAFIRSYVDRLGLTHFVTSDEASFTRELRAGSYNIYWITGGAEKITHLLAGEITEAVQRGDSLLVDGIHDERNRRLDAILGIKHIGKYPDAGLPIHVGGANLAEASLPTAGRSLKLQLQGAVVEAAYTNYAARPAILSNRFGLGRAVLLTFDGVGILQTQADAWLATAQGIFGLIAPALTAPVPEGALTAARFALTNSGSRSVEANAEVELPAGASFVEATPAATFDAATRTLAWKLKLAAGETKELTVWLRAPQAGGAYALTLTAKSATSATAPAVNGGTTLEVADFAALSEEARSAIQALAPSKQNEATARDRAAARLQSALSETAGGQHLAAIQSLVDAGAELRGIASADPQTALTAVARVLAVVEGRVP